MTSDDNEYFYTYDAWGRLITIYGIVGEANVSTMRYNGVGWMKSFAEGATTYWKTHDSFKLYVGHCIFALASET
ncbi:MAG: hypothetical protein H6815_10455 [Phycisphaeraceae bacterium]|nr:hypothetical protein [Phycisphaerales bacterium]MCB9860859.1 hypothetical protein [Phycisphaeraceae bacterium]